MKNWSLGYELVRLYVRLGFWLTHKKMVVTGLRNIPDRKPVIFAPNHQNALMDPLAVSCSNPHQILWLARADIFKSDSARPILKYLKLLPIYRIRDGKDNLSNNEQVFAQVIQILENKQTLALFPEAAHSGRRQMLPHRKAIPRIAFDAEMANGFNLDLHIVPVGIFYDHYWIFNRTLIVQYGEPILVDTYKAEYEENPQKAMISLRDEIQNRISPLTMEIGSSNYYQQYETLRQVAGKAYSKTHFFNKNKYLQRFYAEQDLIKKLGNTEEEKIESFNKLLKKTDNYESSLLKLATTDEQVRIAGETRFLNLFLRIPTTVISLPIFVFGFVFNALPFYIPRMFLRRKVKDVAFLSTFNFAAGLLFFPVFYLIESGIIYSIFCSQRLSVLLFFAFPFAGKIAYRLLLFYQETGQGFLTLTGTKSFRKQLGKLVMKRNELIRMVLQETDNC